MLALRRKIIDFRHKTQKKNASRLIGTRRTQMNYEEAIDALNGLQSNAAYLQRMQSDAANASVTSRSTRADKMQGFLSRLHIDVDRIRSVIHIAGTKGKGSACVLTERILHQHGYKTGFFSSPHLVRVIERIRIDGAPIKQTRFASIFDDVYTRLRKDKDTLGMPIYFEILTLVAFQCFIDEDVDVAIIEVGIGGQFDSTNVLRRVPIVGITSLGLDHTSILGASIEEIAWQKGGIMKPGCRAFTVPQAASALQVLRTRSKDIGCLLEVVDWRQFEAYLCTSQCNNIPYEIYRENTTFALQLATAWLSLQGRELSRELGMLALEQTSWPGRYQVLPQAGGNIYLDGAHTNESIAVCAKWFLQQVQQEMTKVLIFNSTGSRDIHFQLRTLQACNFDRVYFVPNTAFSNELLDSVNHNCTVSQQEANCIAHKHIWSEMFPQHAHSAFVMPSVNDALQDVHRMHLPYALLITGSLHLVGAALQILEKSG